MKNTYQSIAAFVFLATISAASTAESKVESNRIERVQNPEAMPMKGMGGMHHGMGGMGAMGGGMGGMMAGMTEEQKDQHMRSTQEHMLALHDLSNQILAEKDTAKKELLKTKQLQLMKAHHAGMMEGHHKMKAGTPAAAAPAAPAVHAAPTK